MLITFGKVSLIRVKDTPVSGLGLRDSKQKGRPPKAPFTHQPRGRI
jgi:hypothetical protein